MKQVKSKITGDIGELDFDSKEGVFIVVRYDLHTKETIKDYYKSLEDLCEGWEDAPEEPKEFWYVERDGIIFSDTDTITQDYADRLKQIGNYFETEEEAEKAVEKLKAWKRLKDKGLKLELRSGIARGGIRYYLAEESEETEKDLRTCFSSNRFRPKEILWRMSKT